LLGGTDNTRLICYDQKFRNLSLTDFNRATAVVAFSVFARRNTVEYAAKMQQPPTLALLVFICIFANALATLDFSGSQNGVDDLSGVRIDTASAIRDFDNGLITIKANTNVTIRFFGTRLQDLKNVRITRSVQSCVPGDAVGTISADQLIELSPPTATLNFRFPDYATTYYFCFEWLRPSAQSKAWMEARHMNNGTRPPLRERPPRDATEGLFMHQGSARFLSVATASRSWFSSTFG